GASSPALYFNLGLLNKEAGQYDEAVKMLKAAAQGEEYSIPAQFALGQTYYAAKDFKTAIRHFVEVIRLIDLETVDQYKAQSLLEQYENLADNFIARSDAQKITNFITALENFFSKSGWQQRVYQARQRMNSVTEDGRLMTIAEFLESSETEVVISALAMTGEYLKRNLLMTASEECLRAIQNAPTYLPLHARLAEILLKQDHTDAAINKYLYIAKVYQIRNQVDQAIAIFQKILRLAPMDVTVRSKLIDLYISSRDIEQALDQYLILANSYYQLAQVDRALEKYNEALRLTADAANGDTWKVEILNSMGDIYNQRFDWSRAAAAFEELRKIRPNDERTLRQLVDLYFKQRKSEQGVAALDSLMTFYQQQRQGQKLLELLKELVVNYPENVMLRQRLAVIYSRSNLKKQAIAEYDALGEMQMEKGLWDEAVQTIQRILELGPEDAEGYRLLLSKIRGGRG
ncbi:MAG: tetratricopeptide repeat protein, partial [Chloroflexota bacterium]